jgi:hypothetical protein
MWISMVRDQVRMEGGGGPEPGDARDTRGGGAMAGEPRVSFLRAKRTLCTCTYLPFPDNSLVFEF